MADNNIFCSVNGSDDFLAQVGFAPQFCFAKRGSGDAKGLSYFRRLRNSLFLLRQKQLKHPRRPDIATTVSRSIGIPENPKAALAKIDIREKTTGFILYLEVCDGKFNKDCAEG